MQVEFSKISTKQLEKICKQDKKIANRIIKKIHEFANKPDNSFDVKKLDGEFKGFYRLRIGDYRIRFIIENKTITIVTIKHRRDAYE